MNNYRPRRSNYGSKSIGTDASTNTQFEGKKRWMIAQSRNENSQQHRDNITLGMAFHNLLAMVKRKLKGTKQIAFQRNYKYDDTATSMPMYAFLTENLYLYIECAMDHNYVIQYAFYQYPYKKELMAILTPLKLVGRVEQVQLQPDLPTFYKNVLAFQDKRFHIIL